MLYVAITRARNHKQVHLGDGECYTPYTGYIYSYEYNGNCYIGSTTNLTKRKLEHKDGTKAGNTKLNSAFNKYGFSNFKYRVIDTIQFSNVRELWALEDKYINKYNTIANGMNMRRNNKYEI